jgi:hypothetical protein
LWLWHGGGGGRHAACVLVVCVWCVVCVWVGGGCGAAL